MNFAAGYQLAELGEESFADLVAPFVGAGGLTEVFFPWPGHSSGRPVIGVDPATGALDPDAFSRFEADLVRLRAMGLRLDILFNANCYGADAMSAELENEVLSILRRIDKKLGAVEVLTTASPAIAWIVKRAFPSIDVRASVNMRIGSIQGMEYLADRFFSYHIRRDHNRDLRKIAQLKKWADSREKKLVILANSGCLYDCSGQTFHDNLMAHASEAAAVAQNIDGFNPYACWNFLRDRANWPAILQATWIRPEDVHHYEGVVDLMKLATRLHERPQAVIRAYTKGRYAGNLADLFEPGFSPLLAPHLIDNARFPADWFARTSNCSRDCAACGYCAAALEKTLVALS